MPRELCRNFQRGSCRYGAQCKFLHSTPQQQKAGGFGFGGQTGFPQQQQQQKAGGFGFGAPTGFQQQQQNSNPFGFGVKTNTQLGYGADTGPRRDQFKPFANQWTRNAAAPSSRPADNQTQSANHVCTDPESCKRLIAEDFQNERPLWKLTCYGHWKYFPCDIVGDISYEELRTAAYDDARRGLSVQAIVERERSLLNSKLAEFDNLLRNPFVPRPNPSTGQTTSQNAVANPFSSASSNASPPVVSTFSQAASLGAGFGARTSAPTVAAFGNPSPSPAGGNSSPFSNSNMATSVFGMNNSQLGSIGPNSSHLPSQMHVNSTSFGTQGSNTSGFGSLSNLISTAAVLPQVSNPARNQSTSSFGQITSEIQLTNSMQSETISGDARIWLKEKWNPGEIPEEAPPDAFVS